MALTDTQSWLIYRFKAGRIRTRRAMESPWIVNIKAWYKASRVGIFSMRLSDLAHNSGQRFWSRFLYLSRLFWVRRLFMLFNATFGACFFGYVMAGYGTNFYTVGYRTGFV